MYYVSQEYSGQFPDMCDIKLDQLEDIMWQMSAAHIISGLYMDDCPRTSVRI